MMGVGVGSLILPGEEAYEKQMDGEHQRADLPLKHKRRVRGPNQATPSACLPGTMRMIRRQI